MMNERIEITKGQPEENQTMAEDAPPIEGGMVNDIPPIEGGLIIQAEKDLSFHKEKHHADTTRRLAYWLVIVLGGSIAIHYATVLLLEMYGYHKAVESLEKIFNSWLPVISGLVGAATTYYFTKDK